MMKKIIFLFLLSFQLSPLMAQTWDEIIKLYGSYHDAGDNRFGRSVAISGNKAIVGAFFNDEFDELSGSAYTFELVGDTWIETQKLDASDSGYRLRFGVAVSMSGNTALIGALEEDEQGSVYAFELVEDTWVETQKIIASDPMEGGYFGYVISQKDDKAVFGSYGDQSAYIFDLVGDTWTETQKLTASDEEAGSFGYAVCMDDNRVVIGAFAGYGSAYIFDLVGDTWTETQKLTASDEDFNDKFGAAVSISGDYAIIGAYGEHGDAGLFAGSAYIFHLEGDTWVETQKLIASDTEWFSQFGFSVSMSGERLVIGASEDDSNGSNSGSAYIFELDGDTWVETQKLIPSDGSSTDIFGFSVAMDDYSVIVGAYKDSDLIFHGGSAYIFMDLDGEQLSIPENNADKANVYPNPSTGQITVEMNGYFDYDIVDLFGKTVLTGNGSDREILDLTNLSSGVYTILVSHTNSMESIRVIKQ